MKIKCVRHIGINTIDIEKSKTFYENLGFKITSDCSDDSDYINEISQLKNESLRMIKMRNDLIDFNIELIYYKNSEKNANIDPIYKVGISHLALGVQNIEDAWNNLKNLGCIVLSEPKMSEDGYAKVFFCYDPNGFRLEIVEINE